MADFNDEFDELNVPVKPEIPIQYVKLEDAELIERDLGAFADFLKEKALDKYKLLSIIEKEILGGWTQKNLDPILDKLFAESELNRPNWRTVARWRKRYVDSNSELTSLVPARHKMGNRLKRIQGDEIFFDKAVERFLDAKRPTIATAYRYYKDLIIIENENIVDGKIPILSYTSFNNRIKKLPPYDVAVARHGKFKAEELYGACAAHILPTRILERVEIDHTPLDIILLDDELGIPIGRPNLTALIDVFSGCLLGFHLSYNAPSYVSAAKAISHAVKPKLLSSLNITLQNDWPCYGKIENLVVDNGAEFWSDALEHACKETGINTQYNKVGKPQHKPTIERFFGLVNQYFLDEFPGKTFSNILAKEKYDPKKNAVIRFSTFVKEFHRWVVDVYHQDSDSRKTRIPIQQWKKGFDAYPPLEMGDGEGKLFSILFNVVKRPTLGRNGIKFENLMYDSTALSDYRKQYLRTNKTAKKIIKIDPDDLSKIYVYLEELSIYLEVPCTDTTGYTKNLSLFEHKKISKIRRQMIDESKDELALAKARMARHESVKKEQELFLTNKSKAKISSVKKQAQLAGISNTGPGTILVKQDSSSIPNSNDTNNMFDDWDDDLEAFE